MPMHRFLLILACVMTTCAHAADPYLAPFAEADRSVAAAVLQNLPPLDHPSSGWLITSDPRPFSHADRLELQRGDLIVLIDGHGWVPGLCLNALRPTDANAALLCYRPVTGFFNRTLPPGSLGVKTEVRRWPVQAYRQSEEADDRWDPWLSIALQVCHRHPELALQCLNEAQALGYSGDFGTAITIQAAVRLARLDLASAWSAEEIAALDATLRDDVAHARWSAAVRQGDWQQAHALGMRFPATAFGRALATIGAIEDAIPGSTGDQATDLLGLADHPAYVVHPYHDLPWKAKAPKRRHHMLMPPDESGTSTINHYPLERLLLETMLGGLRTDHDTVSISLGPCRSIRADTASDTGYLISNLSDSYRPVDEDVGVTLSFSQDWPRLSIAWDDVATIHDVVLFDPVVAEDGDPSMTIACTKHRLHVQINGRDVVTIPVDWPHADTLAFTVPTGSAHLRLRIEQAATWFRPVQSKDPLGTFIPNEPIALDYRWFSHPLIDILAAESHLRYDLPRGRHIRFMRLGELVHRFDRQDIDRGLITMVVEHLSDDERKSGLPIGIHSDVYLGTVRLNIHGTSKPATSLDEF
jgi:hypothetical protein